ncbi:MAG: glycine cleavage system protein GcvH [Burkholderiales bacterium]|nr:MAG: glycine cleavage system protein GcvH [Burkholderiales bacterium]
MEYPAELHYTQSHEWIRFESDGTATVGITAYAQDHLGELVYVELPTTGTELSQGSACAVVESTKAASDVYAPLSGEVVAVNEALTDAPQTVNESPYGEGWLFRLRPRDDGERAKLIDAAAYGAVVESQS